MPRKANSGGRQPGSGHPTGHALLAATPPVPAPATSATIPPHILTACRMRARGQSYAAIGRALNHDWQTVQRWIERYPETLQAESDLLVDPKSAFRRFTPDVLEGYERILQAPDHRDHATILRDTADRIWDKPRIVQDLRIQASVAIYVVPTPTPTLDMDDDWHVAEVAQTAGEALTSGSEFVASP